MASPGFSTSKQNPYGVPSARLVHLPKGRGAAASLCYRTTPPRDDLREKHASPVLTRQPALFPSRGSVLLRPLLPWFSHQVPAPGYPFAPPPKAKKRKTKPERDELPAKRHGRRHAGKNIPLTNTNLSPGPPEFREHHALQATRPFVRGVIGNKKGG